MLDGTLSEDDIREFEDYCRMAGGKVERSAREIENEGWRPWLMTMYPFAFEEEFSADHCRFWELFWSVLLRIRQQRQYFNVGYVPVGIEEQRQFFEDRECYIAPEEYAILLLLGRGLAKSSTIEAAAVARGCLLGAGYCLYLCESQDQADEHVGNIKGLIDDPDSRVPEFYPHMRIDENIVFKGKKTKNRTDLFITAGGWICRAKGLNASLRGIRIGPFRPDLINVDDIDDVNDSIAVSSKKLRQITTKVMPTQARRHTQVNIGQNLILDTGVIYRIHTGLSDALSARTTIGVSNTFVNFRIDREYVTHLEPETGRVRHKILPSAIPTWKGVDIPAAQKFLDDSGMDAFLAEYMNSFAHLKAGKVFSEWDEARHVITWDAFEAKFGKRFIPGHWRAKASADIGYSKESLSAWLWVACAAKNSPLPGRYFAYRSKTFCMDSIDDQAIDIWKDLFPRPEIGKRNFEATQSFTDYPELYRVLDAKPECSQYLKNFRYDATKNKYELKRLDPRTMDQISDEDKALFYVKRAHITFQSQISNWTLSHEKTGEQKTLAQKYGIPAVKVKRFEADAGVAEANHLLRGDYTQPHPFYPDEIVPETGLYRLGSPFFFVVVERIKAPEGDEDFKTFREQVAAQPWTLEKLTDLGLSKAIPMKYKSDHPDAFRMFAVDYAMPESTPKTLQEEVADRMPQEIREHTGPRTVEQEMAFRSALEYAEEQAKRELGLIDEDDDEGFYYDDED